MRRLAMVCVGMILAPGFVTAQSRYGQGPLRTILPRTLQRGAWDVSTGLIYREDARPPFFGDDPSLIRDELRARVIDVSYGLGGGSQARLEFGAQRFQERGGNDQTGVEDARISFTYQIPLRSTLAAAAHFAVKLPNAPDDDRLGTDQTDVFILSAVGRQTGSFGWAANAGLGLLGSPVRVGDQDDVFVFGTAGWWRPPDVSSGFSAFAELQGVAGSRFDNDERTLGGGVIFSRHVPTSFAVRYGLTAESPDWSAEIRVTLIPPSRR